MHEQIPSTLRRCDWRLLESRRSQQEVQGVAGPRADKGWDKNDNETFSEPQRIAWRQMAIGSLRHARPITTGSLLTPLRNSYFLSSNVFSLRLLSNNRQSCLLDLGRAENKDFICLKWIHVTVVANIYSVAITKYQFILDQYNATEHQILLLMFMMRLLSRYNSKSFLSINRVCG